MRDGVAFPAIVKTARMGYDGKGQRAVARPPPSWPPPSPTLGVECIVEQRVPLDLEISVLVARTADGRTVVYPVAENHHVDGILDLTVVPAARRRRRSPPRRPRWRSPSPSASTTSGCWPSRCSSATAACSSTSWRPRPHNSGHWTLDAARTSQFEQQVRAVCGLALGGDRS